MDHHQPTPFCTTSWAELTSRATEALASKVCGSVFGLLMIALTWTYFPPTWLMTSAYSFSAPTATILPAGSDEPPAEADEQPAASRAALSGRTKARDLTRLHIAGAPRLGVGSSR